MLFGKEAKRKLEIAQKYLAEQERQLLNYQERLAKKEADYHRLLTERDSLQKKLDDTMGQIREQTEADIYLSCVKIMKKIESGATKKDVQPDYDRLMVLMQTRQTQPMAQASPYYGMGALGNAFGRF